MNLRNLILAFAVTVLIPLIAGNAFAQQPDEKEDAVRPLKEAWLSLVPGGDALRQRLRTSDFHRYELQNREIRQLSEATANQRYSVRMKAVTIREPQAHDQYPQGLVLLQGRFVDKEYQAVFGEDAQIDIWVKDHETVRDLALGQEFDFQGEVTYVVSYFDKDVDRVEHRWQDEAINTSVASLQTQLTGFKRNLDIYVLNGLVVPIDDEQRGLDRDSASRLTGR